MFILKKGHQPGVYVPLRALFLVVLMLLYTACCLLCLWLDRGSVLKKAFTAKPVLRGHSECKCQRDAKLVSVKGMPGLKVSRDKGMPSF